MTPKLPPIADSTGALAQASHRLAQAERARQMRDLSKARRICEELLSHDPDYVAALQTLGLCLADGNEYSAALAPLSRAVMLCPTDWRLRVALSAVSLKLNHLEAARMNLLAARERAPENPDVLLMLGEAHRKERDYGEAAAIYRLCLKVDPARSEAMRLLADCLSHMGEAKESANLLQTLIAQGKANMSAFALLCNLPFDCVRFDVLAALDEVLKTRPGADIERANQQAAFVRAWALNGRKDYDMAWGELVAANGLKWKSVAAELGKEQLYRQHVLQAAKAQATMALPSPRTDIPISLFIVGPSRSGKTTLELLIGGLPQVRCGHEADIVDQAVRLATQTGGVPTRSALNFMPPQLNDLFRQAYVEKLRHRAGQSLVFASTHPGRTADLLRIAAVVPNTRIVFMRRQKDDTAFRMFEKSYLDGNSHSYNLQAIGEYLDWYRDLVVAQTRIIAPIATVIDYEDMVERPGEALARVAALCGIKAPDAIDASISDDRGCSLPYRKHFPWAQI